MVVKMVVKARKCKNTVFPKLRKPCNKAIYNLKLFSDIRNDT